MSKTTRLTLDPFPPDEAKRLNTLLQADQIQKCQMPSGSSRTLPANLSLENPSPETRRREFVLTEHHPWLTTCAVVTDNGLDEFGIAPNAESPHALAYLYMVMPPPTRSHGYMYFSPTNFMPTLFESPAARARFFDSLKDWSTNV